MTAAPPQYSHFLPGNCAGNGMCIVMCDGLRSPTGGFVVCAYCKSLTLFWRSGPEKTNRADSTGCDRETACIDTCAVDHFHNIVQ